jgi:NAD(P)H dehydrogenase (quinone)
MVYVVAGVSGNTGKVAAETLLNAGKQIRVLVRDAAKGADWARRGAEVAVANLEDASSLSSALRGAEGAYLLVPPNLSTQHFGAYQRRVIDAIVTAARATELPRLVFLSSIGAHLPGGTGPITAIHYAENQLRDLPRTKSTFLRAGYFMENLATSLGALEQGILPTFGATDVPFHMVATVDIGKTAAELLIEPAQATTAVQLAGPPRSFNDAARILSEIVNKPVRAVESPVSGMAQALQSFGIPRELAELYQEMTDAFNSGRIGWEPGLRQIQGTTDLEVVLRGLLAGPKKV